VVEADMKDVGTSIIFHYWTCLLTGFVDFNLNLNQSLGLLFIKDSIRMLRCEVPMIETLED